MKSFRNFIISEEVDLTANVERGVMDVHDHAVRNNINAFLNGELGCNVVTPYVALNKVNKVLANFHIFLPKAPYMEDDQGVHVFNIKQFNRVAGMRNDGSVVTKVEQPYHLYFEWKRNERGMFDTFAEIVTDEELADLIKAVEEDVSGESDLYEAEEKEIKKAYKVAAKNPDAPKVEKHLRAAAKAVKKKLERGEKIDEAEDADFIGKTLKYIGINVDREYPAEKNPNRGKPGDICQGTDCKIKPFGQDTPMGQRGAPKPKKGADNYSEPPLNPKPQVREAPVTKSLPKETSVKGSTEYNYASGGKTIDAPGYKLWQSPEVAKLKESFSQRLKKKV